METSYGADSDTGILQACFKAFTKGFSNRIGTASKPTYAIADVARTVGLRTFRRGGTTDAKDCFVHPTAGSERQAARPCVGRNARAHYRLNACRPATRQWQDGARDQGSGGATGSSDCWRQPRAQGMDVEYGIGLGEDRSGGHAAQQQRGSAGRHRGRGARATCARPLPRSLS